MAFCCKAKRNVLNILKLCYASDRIYKIIFRQSKTCKKVDMKIITYKIRIQTYKVNHPLCCLLAIYLTFAQFHTCCTHLLLNHLPSTSSFLCLHGVRVFPFSHRNPFSAGNGTLSPVGPATSRAIRLNVSFNFFVDRVFKICKIEYV